SDLLAFDLAVLEEDEGRNAAHVEALRCLGVLVDVELHDRELVAVLLGDVVQHGGDRLAGTAPLRPEVDEHRAGCLQHILLETGVADVRDLFTRRQEKSPVRYVCSPDHGRAAKRSMQLCAQGKEPDAKPKVTRQSCSGTMRWS